MAYRILVVDDEPTLVRLMEFILAKQGHTMLVATNGEEGLAKARAEKPDLILLDIMMPRIDGYEVARRVRADAEINATPIIMLSAKAQDDDVKKGLEVGVDEYITKPFSPEHLVHVVNDYLSHLQPDK
ncbi:MAG: response regulator [Capsulimonadaceae bacterium]|nr:response regulator [Capsulimonadaceae bacterium]